jgi:Tol biopolymer transport system component
MHKILHGTPEPIEHLNPEGPAELRRLIRRCLAKAPDQRLQSMKDLAIEIADIVQDFDNLSLSSASHVSGVAPAVAAPGPRRQARRLGMAVVAIVGLAGLAFGLFGLLQRRGGHEPEAGGFQSMRMTRLTTSGNVASASLSRDGRYLAHVIRQGGQQSLWVRQVATGSQVEIVPAQDQAIGEVCFSPDGEYLYYLKRDPEAPLYRALYQVASLGGTPRKILFDVDAAPAFSPDGRELAFVRGYPHLGESALLLSRTDGSSERKLVVMKQPEALVLVAPSWSPDGTRIAMFTSHDPGVKIQAAVVTVADGKRVPVGADNFLVVSALAWLPTGDGIIVSGGERGGSLNSQLWRLSYPGGELRRITNDLNAYQGVSVAADGRRIVTVRTDQISNLWVAPASDPTAAKQITFGSSGDDAIGPFEVATNGSIVFQARLEDRVHLHTIASNGTGRKAITSGPSYCFNPHAAAAAPVVVFGSVREAEWPHVWTVDLDGGNLRQVTNGAGEFATGVDPEGRSVYYTRMDSTRSLWKVPLIGGTPAKVARRFTSFIGVSSDRTRIAYAYLQLEGDRVRSILAVGPSEGGEPTVTIPDPPAASFYAWAPTGDAIDFEKETAGTGNLWRLPLAGGTPRQLTHFTSLRIFAFAWSPDGKQLVLTRGEATQDVVLISDFQ